MENQELTAATRDNMAHIFALQALANALIATHPDKKALAAAYEQFAASVPVMLQATTWTEEQISYAEKALGQFRKSLQK